MRSSCFFRTGTVELLARDKHVRALTCKLYLDRSGALLQPPVAPSSTSNVLNEVAMYYVRTRDIDLETRKGMVELCDVLGGLGWISSERKEFILQNVMSAISPPSYTEAVGDERG